MIVDTCRGEIAGKSEAARHSQVDENHPVTDVGQKIFPSPTQPLNPLPYQGVGRTAQRPAQGLSQIDRLDASAGNAVGKASASHFDFR